MTGTGCACFDAFTSRQQYLPSFHTITIRSVPYIKLNMFHWITPLIWRFDLRFCSYILALPSQIYVFCVSQPTLELVLVTMVLLFVGIACGLFPPLHCPNNFIYDTERMVIVWKHGKYCWRDVNASKHACPVPVMLFTLSPLFHWITPLIWRFDFWFCS